MTKTVSLCGRPFRVSGSASDRYYAEIPEGRDVTDSVVLGIRQYLAEDFVCVDVGASIGLFSLALSLLVPGGKVYALEPSPSSYASLSANLAVNGVENVEAFQLAATNISGTLSFNDIPQFSAGSFPVTPEFRAMAEAMSSRVMEVSAVSLDDFVSEHQVERLDLIKIDVEGGELAVLEGARDTLARDRPLVVMEFNGLCLDLFQGLSSRVVLEQLRQTFPHIFVMDRTDGSLTRLGTDAEAHRLLYQNGTVGRVDNLVCSFGDLAVTRDYADVAVTDPDRVALETALAETRSNLAKARAEVDRMHATASWRVTRPLQWLAARIAGAVRRVAGHGR